MNEISGGIICSQSPQGYQSSPYGELYNIRAKRILTELKIACEDTSNCFSAGPNDTSNSSFDIWRVKLFGNADTIYFGKVFDLLVTFPDEYPLVPPKIFFLTRMFHPNINNLGQICLDILNESWISTLNMTTIFHAILFLLENPNPFDPLNPQASALYLANYQLYLAEVAKYLQ